MNRDLVLAEWGRARMALGAAQLLTAEDYPEDADEVDLEDYH